MCEHSAVEDKHDSFGPVRSGRYPIDSEHSAGCHGEAKFSREFAMAASRGDSLASTVPPGSSQ